MKPSAPTTRERAAAAEAAAQAASNSGSRADGRASGEAGMRLGNARRLGEALRASREAITDIQRQLDALLSVVQAPSGRPPSDAADRLRRATKRAGVAMNRLAVV